MSSQKRKKEKKKDYLLTFPTYHFCPLSSPFLFTPPSLPAALSRSLSRFLFLPIYPSALPSLLHYSLPPSSQLSLPDSPPFIQPSISITKPHLISATLQTSVHLSPHLWSTFCEALWFLCHHFPSPAQRIFRSPLLLIHLRPFYYHDLVHPPRHFPFRCGRKAESIRV